MVIDRVSWARGFGLEGFSSGAVGRTGAVRGLIVLVCSAIFAASTAGPSNAQASLEGVWYGSVEKYHYDSNPDRELFIAADGTCRWDYAKTKKRRGPDKADCKVDHAAGTVELVTSGRSKVRLKRTPEGRLKGLFLMAFGGSELPFSITMSRRLTP
jgi:hypothetical protein